jgi:hypothetical protein
MKNTQQTERDALNSIPYTQRSVSELDAEIEAYEENTPHDQLPTRYDALVAFRNRRHAAND